MVTAFTTPWAGTHSIGSMAYYEYQHTRTLFFLLFEGMRVGYDAHRKHVTEEVRDRLPLRSQMVAMDPSTGAIRCLLNISSMISRFGMLRPHGMHIDEDAGQLFLADSVMGASHSLNFHPPPECLRPSGAIYPNNPTYEPTTTATTPPSHPQTIPAHAPGNPSRCDHS